MLASAPGLQRVSRVLLVAIVLAAGLMAVSVTKAPPAHAYTCQQWHRHTLNDGSAKATVNFGRNCSDGLSHIYGTIYDINCDGRTAYLHIRFFNGGNLFPFRGELPRAGNGCNTSASYHYSSTNRSPRVHAFAYAANSGPSQSSGHGIWMNA